MSWWGQYIGLPFGEGPGEVTCWGLIRQVYRDRLGVELPAYGEISARDLVRVARTMEAHKDDDGWTVPDRPEPLDVVLMRGPRGLARVSHVGLMVAPGHLMHVEAASATVCVPLGHFTVAGRILGYRRLQR